jgi:class 3 adenylate cyclase/tetratricopeptide (TPR) repeat protein
MTFDEILDQAITMLQRRGRLTYGALKRQFNLDDAYLEDLKNEIIYGQQLARDEDGRLLVWLQEAAAAPPSVAPMRDHERAPRSYTPQHLAAKILQSRAALEGERKQVTILFADVAGFTTIAERLDPEEVHLLMDGCFARLTDAVHRYEGTVNQYTGDGIMALFGAPIAHEDHPQRAVLAALTIQETMRPYSEQLQRDMHLDLRLRIGINTGLVVVGRIGDDLRMDYTAQGDTTNLAARLQALAEPGTILLSEQTYRLTHGYFTFRHLGECPIKGRAPAQAFQVVGRQAGRTRIDIAAEHGLTSFVGRQREMDTLETLLGMVKQGHGQIVGVLGEAGMGKSRLLLEFRRRLQQENITYLEGRCLSYGQSILYLPLIDILKKHFAIEEESDQAIAERVISGAEQVGLNAPTFVPYLIALLSGRTDDPVLQGLAPEARRKQTFEVLRTLFLTMSRQRPLVLTIEDPHWIDQPSAAFLSLLAESVGAAPLMLLLSHRPGYHHQWGEKSYSTQISLQPLRNDESRTLITSVLGEAEVTPDLQELILQKAEGNPFYLEEIIRSFLEHGLIQRDGEGYRLSRTITPRDVPETIQDVIASRLDRLPESQKRTVQTAAVIGREFAVRLLRRIADLQDQLSDCLIELQNLEFIYEKSVFPDLEYMFKHVLTQEAAYNSLLSTRRRALHTAIGMAMEELFQERLAERYEELAHHFTQGETWDKAFVYLCKAGDKARLAYANQEAVAFYSQAIAVSAHIIPSLEAVQLLPVYEGRGLVWMFLSKYDDAIADFNTMQEMARTLNSQQKEGESLCHLANAHFMKFSEDQLVAGDYAQQALQLSQRTADHRVFAKSLSILGFVYQGRGNLAEADRNFAASLVISRREGYQDALSQTLMLLGHQAYWQGNFPQAITLGHEGMTAARDVSDGFNELYNLALLCLAYESVGEYGRTWDMLQDGLHKARERQNQFFIGRLLNSLGWFYSEFGDVVQAIAYDSESMELGRTHRISNVEISALINLGLNYFALGQYDHALSLLEPTLERVQGETFGAHRWRWKIRLLIGLAETHYTMGAYEQATRYVEEGLREAQKTSSQKYVAKGLALRGKIAAQLGDVEAAGTDLQRALTLAEPLQSPALLYPLAHDLGQWYARRGQEEETVELYRKAKAAIDRMASAVENEALRSIFLQLPRVQLICSNVP